MRRREGLPFVSPLFTQVRRTGILRSSHRAGPMLIIPLGCIRAPLGQALRTGARAVPLSKYTYLST
jgi:hypothetical protein